VKGSGKKTTEKIGEAKLPLSFLVSKEYGPQVQEIKFRSNSGMEVTIGKIYFNARMRKSLDEAIKWQIEKRNVNDKQTDDLRKLNDKIGYNNSRGNNA